MSTHDAYHTMAIESSDLCGWNEMETSRALSSDALTFIQDDPTLMMRNVVPWMVVDIANQPNGTKAHIAKADSARRGRIRTNSRTNEPTHAPTNQRIAL